MPSLPVDQGHQVSLASDDTRSICLPKTPGLPDGRRYQVYPLVTDTRSTCRSKPPGLFAGQRQQVFPLAEETMSTLPAVDTRSTCQTQTPGLPHRPHTSGQTASLGPQVYPLEWHTRSTRANSETCSTPLGSDASSTQRAQTPALDSAASALVPTPPQPDQCLESPSYSPSLPALPRRHVPSPSQHHAEIPAPRHTS
ncbi:hypothetical protein BTVI_50944 [Pitangus sulphuratus]|nr:hypothetical protein BTVI_50944 [Pitangus sulphuratus]